MSESAVTVITCRRCRRSSDLALSDGRVWCARCQDWSAVDVERIADAAVVRDGPVPRLAAVPPATPGRQPLRVAPGWLVRYNDFGEADPTAAWTTRDELLVAVHEARGRLLTLQWSFDDAGEGAYDLTLWADPDGDRALRSVRSRDRVEIVAAVERLLADVSGGRA